MKKSFLIFLILPIFLKAQSLNYRHPSTLGVHLFSNDFKSSTLFNGYKNQDHGIGMTYLKGLSSLLDWTIQVNGSFADSVSKIQTAVGDKNLLLQSDAMLRIRSLRRSSWIQPYMIGGVGTALYRSRLSAYLPLGTGLELNYKAAFLVMNVQYRMPLLQNLNKHFYYSIGISGIISNRNTKKKQQQVSYFPMATPALPVQRVDRDGDGILDSVDRCPDQPGIQLFAGCPDQDHDDIEDSHDKCPDLFGMVAYLGCPLKDSDGDGINDEQDSCKLIPGFALYKGCPVPDQDHDGVNDAIDQCPLTFGILANKGCPPIQPQLSEEMRKAAQNIFFATGRYELLSESFPALDKVVTILIQSPELKLRIEGHTDDQGDQSDNQILSENRAQAVLQYIRNKYINAFRLEAYGFGQTRPIAPNKDQQGRAKNRRVELILFY